MTATRGSGHTRLSEKDGPSSMGPSGARVLGLPGHLLRAAHQYDGPPQPNPTVLARRKGQPSGKAVCTRCGEPRRVDALADGVCRYQRKCDEALGVTRMIERRGR